MIHQIVSIKDPRIVEVRELSTASGRQARQKCLLEGRQIIQWALDAQKFVEHVFYDVNVPENDAFLQILAEQNIACFAVTDGILKKISGTRYLIPFIGVTTITHSVSLPNSDFVLVLDRVNDHGNIGTIIML